jgi:hypothetical protein
MAADEKCGQCKSREKIMNRRQVDRVRLVIAVALVFILVLVVLQFCVYMEPPPVPTPGPTTTPMDVNPGGAGDWWNTRVAATPSG